jgi:hypothetical protein
MTRCKFLHLMGGGSQIGSPLLEVDFDFVPAMRLSLVWLFCVSRL